MWLILFLSLLPQADSGLDYNVFTAKVQPLFTEKRPGHARCVACHANSTPFRLQPLPKGRTTYTDEESHKNFAAASRMVVPGVPLKSRLLTMPLAHEAGGTEFHPGGKHWMSQGDPEWKILADWVRAAK